jgi:O-antigen/teichoic acid export membrane protein
MNPNEPPSDSETKENVNVKSHAHFVTPSIFLFLDNILVSAGNWIYWLLISKMTSSSEIGIAVSVYSLIMLTTTLTQLGLEYPLLKKSNTAGSKILGTSLLIESIIIMVSIPFVIIIVNTLYAKSIEHFTLISILLLITISLEFILRFVLLGISNSKAVLLIDLVGLGIKFVTGLVLVHLSIEAMGILLAYLVEGFFITFASFLVVKKSFSINIGNKAYFKEILKDALINTPAKWSKTVIVMLSIVILALMNINASDVGVFYISMIITVVVGGISSSMAYMVIPAFNTLKRDLSSSSIRISLSLTAPFVVALLVVPRSILSLIGQEYTSAETVLTILALSIIPAAITVNMISMLNNLGKSKMLITIGILQIVTFLVCFFVLVPTYGILGAAISILVAYCVTSATLLYSTDHQSFKYVLFTSFSICAGIIVGYILGIIIGNNLEFVVAAGSVGASVAVIILSKNLTIRELSLMGKAVIQGR